MTGTGTAADPYIITTAAELYEMEDVGSRSKYFRLGGDIDFNGTEYAGNLTTIRMHCKCLDGDGHTIRGIYKNASGSSFTLFTDTTSFGNAYVTTIKNLTLEAEIIADNITIFNYTSANNSYTIENCCFTFNLTEGAASTRALLCNSYLSLNFKKSTLIVNSDIYAAHPIMKKGSFTGSQVRAKTVLRSADATATDSALWHTVNVTDTGFFGSVELRNGSETPSAVLWAYAGTHSNAYQVTEYKNVSEALWNSTISTVCFYDREKKGSAEIKNTVAEVRDALIHGLTTAECTNAEYLRSIGYVCEGEE